MKHFSSQSIFIMSLMAFLVVLGISTILISNHISKIQVVSISTPKASGVFDVPTINATKEAPEAIDTPINTATTTETNPKVSGQKTSPVNKPTSQVAGAKTDSCEGTLVIKFTCLLNEYRKSKNLGKVSYNSSLSKVAYDHSNWMNTTKTLSHIDANGFRHNDRCAQAGIICRAENLAEGYMDANILLTEWQKSGSHNTNLLGPYSTIGLGISGKYITLLLN